MSQQQPEMKKPTDRPRYVVAQVEKVWTDGESREVRELSELFEETLRTQTSDGYALHSFRISQLKIDHNVLRETITAVFERS